MSNRHDDAHRWFASHVADHLLDLLDAEESARLEAHARECEACGRRLAAARAAKPDWWEGAGHPPVALLVAHAEHPEALDEPTRAFLSRHLESCAECREELGLLTGAPEAPAFSAVAASVESRPMPAYAPWAFAGGLAATIALFVFLIPQRAPEPVAALRPEARQPSAPEVSPAPSGALPTPGSPAPASVTLSPVAIAGAVRGGAAEPTRVVIPAGVAEVPFTLPALFVPEGATLVIELRGEGDLVLSRDEIPAARALAPGGLRLPVGRLTSGARVLRVAWFDDSSGAESREYPLVVEQH